MEIQSIKNLLKVKLLKIRKLNHENLDEIKSQSLNLKSHQKQKPHLKLDFIKELNDKEKCLLSYNSLKYIPKRLSHINLEEQNYSKVINSSSPKITNNFHVNLNEKFNYIIKKMKSDSIYNVKKISNFTGIKFRNEYKLKYDLLINNYEKLMLRIDNINEVNKYNYQKYLERIINCLKNQSSLLFNPIINLEKEETREFILNMEEYSHFVNKILSILFNEIDSKTETNNNISKINGELETENYTNNNEIQRLKKIINNPKIKKLYANKEKAEEQITKAKLSFLTEKNDYKILVNELTKEIQNLYKMLNKNKEYYDKFIQDEIIIKELKNEKRELKTKYTEEINKLNEQNLMDKITISNLNNKIEELNNNLQEIKIEEKNYMNYKIQIKNLQLQNNKIFENYLMLKEELDSYLYLQRKH